MVMALGSLGKEPPACFVLQRIPMQAPHLELGRDAEDAALDYFLACTPRARLLERNRRFRCGELDLIFEVGEVGAGSSAELVFVEVRARSGGGMAKGFETIGPAKRARLRRAIGVFLSRYPSRSRRTQTMRVDILSWDSGKWTHLKNVWL